MAAAQKDWFDQSVSFEQKEASSIVLCSGIAMTNTHKGRW